MFGKEVAKQEVVEIEYDDRLPREGRDQVVSNAPRRGAPDLIVHDPSSGRIVKYLIAFVLGAVAFTIMAVWIGDWPRKSAIFFGVCVAFCFILVMRTRSLVFMLSTTLVGLIFTSLSWHGASALAKLCESGFQEAQDLQRNELLLRICTEESVRDFLEIVSATSQPSIEGMATLLGFALLLILLILGILWIAGRARSRPKNQ